MKAGVLKKTRYPKGQKGQGLVEYALIILFIAIAAVLALSLIPGPIVQILESVLDI